ncbi:aspartate carbamoyltransferase catalytic subunit [Virgibacillus soli]|uniref:aspartate carbamoyltransferase catalytic subunit n=1 Tax=Paracerasibacillus soli TaxID=480284 RepID=UPI0035F09795
MRHLLSVQDVSENDIFALLQLATEFQKNKINSVNQKIAVNLFFEPSTRTKLSFMVAQKKLGFESLDFHQETSSVQKGESFYDTVKTMEAIGADLLVIRHEDDHWPDRVKDHVSIPIINAGAGKIEHPTQCLLDLLTIYQEFGTFQNVRVAIVGDIIHSRVAHSNADALHRLGADVYLSAAPYFQDNTFSYPYITIDEAVRTCDVIMLLRIQHERHDCFTGGIENYLEQYGLSEERGKEMKKSAIILHPAPVNRDVEIASNLVESRQSRIFKQMSNGVYMRMAIMTLLLQEWGIKHENIIEKRQQFRTNKQTGTM